jgi:hypothetical protein
MKWRAATQVATFSFSFFFAKFLTARAATRASRLDLMGAAELGA